MEKDNAQYVKMICTPVGKLVISLGIPTVLSMLVTAVYNVGDTFFVSKLGTSASGAVGIVFSLMAIIQAVGFTIGMGTGTQISRLLGAQKDDEACMVGISGLFAAVFFGSLLAVVGLSCMDGLMKLLGATDTILPYARLQTTIIFPSVCMFCIVGVYALNQSLIDVWVMLFFAVFGYILMKFKFPSACLLIGFILSPILEKNYRLALLISNNDYGIFFKTPITWILWAITVFSLFTILRGKHRYRVAQRNRAKA
jgi:hypothetical protein